MMTATGMTSLNPQLLLLNYPRLKAPEAIIHLLPRKNNPLKIAKTNLIPLQTLVPLARLRTKSESKRRNDKNRRKNKPIRWPN